MESSEQPKESTPPNTPDISEKNPEAIEAQSEHTEDSKIESRFGVAERKVKDAVSSFFRKHIKGERLPDEDQAGMSKADVAQAIGGGMVGAAASIGGIKSFADVPRWFTQKYFTGQEKSRIQEVLSSQESSPEPVSVSQKKQAIEKAVTDSKYLSPDKKNELIQQLQETIEKYETELAQSEIAKNEAIAKLLDEAINTRVKGSTAIKETMNTALTASGLVTLRGLGYGAVALYERGVKVSAEMEKGERGDTFAKELIVNGFKETFNAITFSEGKTKREKVVNAAKAIGTVMRFAGFSRLAEMEISNEGVSGAIDKALDLFEQKGVIGAARENVEHHIDKVTLGLLRNESTPATEHPSSDQTPPPASVPKELPTINISAGSPETESVQTIAATAGAESPAPTIQIVEASSDPEIVKDDLQLATIRKGDGFIKIAERQLKANPEKFGFTGDPSDTTSVTKWAKKMANAITKQSHLMNSRLTGEGIGKVAVILETHDRKIGFQFIDTKTGEQIPSQKNLVYEGKIAPKTLRELKQPLSERASSRIETSHPSATITEPAHREVVVESTTAPHTPESTNPAIEQPQPASETVPTSLKPLSETAPTADVSHTKIPPTPTEQTTPIQPENIAATEHLQQKTTLGEVTFDHGSQGSVMEVKGKGWIMKYTSTKTPDGKNGFKLEPQVVFSGRGGAVFTRIETIPQSVLARSLDASMEIENIQSDVNQMDKDLKLVRAFRTIGKIDSEDGRYAMQTLKNHIEQFHNKYPELKLPGGSALAKELGLSQDLFIDEKTATETLASDSEAPTNPPQNTSAEKETIIPVEHLERKTDQGIVRFEHSDKESQLEIQGAGWNLKYSSTTTNEGGVSKIHTKILLEGRQKSLFEHVNTPTESLLEKGGNIDTQKERANLALDELDKQLKIARAFKAIGKQNSEDGDRVFQVFKKHLEKFREKYPDILLPEKEIKKVLGS